MLLDSNILIYYSKNGDQISSIEPYITEESSISAIGKLEVLGYHALATQEKSILEITLGMMNIIPVSFSVIDKAIALRQQKSMSVGDALIAATALEYGMTLITRNTSDFKWIDGLSLVNPFDA